MWMSVEQLPTAPNKLCTGTAHPALYLTVMLPDSATTQFDTLHKTIPHLHYTISFTIPQTPHPFATTHPVHHNTPHIITSHPSYPLNPTNTTQYTQTNTTPYSFDTNYLTPHCTIPHRITLSHFPPHDTTSLQHGVMAPHTTTNHTIPYCNSLHHTTPHHITTQPRPPHHTTVIHSTLHHTVLHHIITA